LTQTRSSRETVSLIVLLGSLGAFDPISIDMYLPAFPNIAKDLHTTAPMVEISLTSFFIGLAVGQLIYGPLSDHYGRKKPLLAGMSVYFLSCFGCAFSRSIHMLILFRVLQALGGCAGMVITRAMVRDLFDKQRAAHIFSIMILVSGLAPILAPIAGGYLAKYFSWRAIFEVLGAFCFVTLVSSSLFLPETHRPTQRHISFNSMVRTYRELLHDRHFLGYALSGGAIYAGMFAYIAGSPFVLINLFGVRPEHYGWIFGTNAVGIVALAQINRVLLKRFDSERILKIVTRYSAGFAIALFVSALTSRHLITFLVPLFLFLAVNGLVFPNSSASALAHQGRRAGTASSLLGTLQWSMACLSSFLVSFLHNGTALPMVGVMLGSGLIGMVTLQFIACKAPRLQTSADDAQLSFEAD
jgi:DHA1 family bicyclomycin/chloramphenicol resistance-like MFS transporter